MQSLQNLLAKQLPRLTLRAQHHVKSLMYEAYLSMDREEFTGLDLSEERQVIWDRIRSILSNDQYKHLRSFRWFGGKYSKLDFLLPALPEATTYVEPFAGSAAVLLNRDPSKIEVLSDLDGELMNFFEVLRAPQSRDRLIEQLRLTPYSRGEYLSALQPGRGRLTELERARRFFVKATQVRNGLAQCADRANWSYSRTAINKNLQSKLGLIAELPLIAERLLHVSLENRDALKIISLYDSLQTLHYCDPPYVHSTRSRTGGAYHREMSDNDHRELAQVLNAVMGKAAISGYDSPLYRELYRNWNRQEDRFRTKPSGKKKAQEILWTNY